MESFLYINMTYDELQSLAKMKTENSVFEFLKTRYEIEESVNIVSIKIDNTKLTLTLTHNEKD